MDVCLSVSYETLSVQKDMMLMTHCFVLGIRVVLSGAKL